MPYYPPLFYRHSTTADRHEGLPGECSARHHPERSNRLITGLIELLSHQAHEPDVELLSQGLN
ncbi:hypothetical protein SPB21_08690 [Leptothoe sp. ISB3NOV94-8A]|uniref:hypothetical protein n=1 Tax=Adonisia turfae TaxID=2950184 RepID=UPI0013D85DBB|nr:hypothetical protein [Adonisia turfae]MDV3349031.1 hypothetical protein [Leptothoe sp. LEGE 181152]